MRALLPVFLLFLLGLALPAAGDEPVRIFHFKKWAPFIVGADNRLAPGMSEKTISLLQVENDDRRFINVAIPRPRLDRELRKWTEGECPAPDARCDDSWIVLWATSELGLGDWAADRFRWVDLFEDRFLVMTAPGRSLDPDKPEQFTGLTLAMMRGHPLPPLLQQFADEGRIRIQFGDYDHGQVLRVAAGRADFALAQESALRFARLFNQRDPDLPKPVEVGDKPVMTFKIKAMIPPTRPDLEAIVRQMVQTEAWAELLASYGIKASPS